MDMLPDVSLSSASRSHRIKRDFGKNWYWITNVPWTACILFIWSWNTILADFSTNTDSFLTITAGVCSKWKIHTGENAAFWLEMVQALVRMICICWSTNTRLEPIWCIRFLTARTGGQVSTASPTVFMRQNCVMNFTTTLNHHFLPLKRPIGKWQNERWKPRMYTRLPANDTKSREIFLPIVW